jgi:hypothetical protein
MVLFENEKNNTCWAGHIPLHICDEKNNMHKGRITEQRGRP